MSGVVAQMEIRDWDTNELLANFSKPSEAPGPCVGDYLFLKSGEFQVLQVRHHYERVECPVIEVRAARVVVDDEEIVEEEHSRA